MQILQQRHSKQIQYPLLLSVKLSVMDFSSSSLLFILITETNVKNLTLLPQGCSLSSAPYTTSMGCCDSEHLQKNNKVYKFTLHSVECRSKRIHGLCLVWLVSCCSWFAKQSPPSFLCLLQGVRSVRAGILPRRHWSNTC